MRIVNSMLPLSFLVVSGSVVACGNTPGNAATQSQQENSCTPDDPFTCSHHATSKWVSALQPGSVDGTDNNQTSSTWGSANQPLLRTATIAYADGLSTPARPNDASPRAISNAMSAQSGSIPNDFGASNFLWQWGQFMDHDMDLASAATPAENFNIPVPSGDPQFDPANTGTAIIPFTRNAHITDSSGVRQQVNRISAYIDGSNIYGSDPVRASTLRANDGTGRLLTSAGNLLPFNTFGLENANMGPSPATSLFVSGDIRVNEQVGLTSMHTLFMREHNRIVGILKNDFPELTDEQLYQAGRAIVGAEEERITYYNFLPTLLGYDAIPPYRGYDPTVNASIENLFAHACYRVGHTLLTTKLLMLGSSGEQIDDLSLRTAFFVPDQIVMGGGIEPLLRGLAAREAQQVDPYVVDDVRNFLFGKPGSGGLDLPSLNLQRGRDHGLPSYNDARRDYGLRRVHSFSDISSNPVIAANLASVYASVDDVDPWIGALSEDHVQGAMVGELIYAVLSDQFGRLRDGDRFYYENSLPQYFVQWVNTQTLAMIIRRNTSIGYEIQDDVFHVPFSSVPEAGTDDGGSPSEDGAFDATSTSDVDTSDAGPSEDGSSE
jgi:peroxidase